MPVVIGACEYPTDVEDRLPTNRKAIDALTLAEKAGNSKTANSVMLGALTKALNLDKEKMENALLQSIPLKLAEINKVAFNLGYEN